MPWIKVTGPNGDPVHLSVEQMVLVRAAGTGEAAPGAKAVIDLSNGHEQAVRETAEEIVTLLRQ
jgi:hypothetical protein